MTIAERINLHRCGYTKDEINALAEREKEELAPPADNPAQTPADNPAQTPADNPAQTPADNPAQTPADNPAQTPADNPVLKAIQDLTAAINQSNINRTPQPIEKVETVNDLIKNI